MTGSDRDRLVAERDHLLRSLDDLDEELGAGDIDRTDYDQLRDDYVARAAALTRAIEGSAPVDASPVAPTRWRQRLAWMAVVSLVAIAGAWAMAEFSGARGAGDTASGEIRQGTTTLLADAAAAFGRGEPDEAIELYGEVLALQPTNVEALTYRGWVRYQTGDVAGASQDFDEAVSFDPGYSDVRVFRAVAALDRGDFDQADEELEAFDTADPSPVARQLVEQRQLRERTAAGRMLDLLDTGAELDLVTAGIDLDDAQLAAELFVQLAQPADALATFDAILEVDSEYAPALAWRGWTLALTAEAGAPELFDDAEEWLRRAVIADSTYPDARVFRAFLFRRLDRRDESAAELRTFDELADQPADMLALIEQFDLREVLDQ